MTTNQQIDAIHADYIARVEAQRALEILVGIIVLALILEAIEG